MFQQSPYPVSWVPPSPPIPGCPPGLENLIPLDYLWVQQQIEVLELLSDFETENKYYVKNRWGQILFYAEEDSTCCARNCFQLCRPFDMRITDITQRELIHIHHPSAMCINELFVQSPVGVDIGKVQQICNFSTPSFDVNDAAGHKIFSIQGPPGYALCGCCRRNVDFKVLTLDGVTQVGMISKVYSGYAQERMTDADNFAVSFPVNLDVRMKAVMLGACVLIDMVYFESSAN